MIGYAPTGLAEAADVLNPEVPLTTLFASPSTNPEMVAVNAGTESPYSMLFESAITRQASRIVALKDPTDEQLCALEPGDIGLG